MIANGFPLPPNCLSWVNAHRWLTIFAVILGIVGAPGIVFGVRLYIDSIRPEPSSLERITVFPRNQFGGVEIDATFHTLNTPKCTWTSTHQISRPADNPEEGERRYVLIAAASAGGGFSVLARSKYTLGFHLGSTVHPGTYLYRYRATYECGWLNLIPFKDELSQEIVIP